MIRWEEYGTGGVRAEGGGRGGGGARPTADALGCAHDACACRCPPSARTWSPRALYFCKRSRRGAERPSCTPPSAGMPLQRPSGTQMPTTWSWRTSGTRRGSCNARYSGARCSGVLCCVCVSVGGLVGRWARMACLRTPLSPCTRALAFSFLFPPEGLVASVVVAGACSLGSPYFLEGVVVWEGQHRAPLGGSGGPCEGEPSSQVQGSPPSDSAPLASCFDCCVHGFSTLETDKLSLVPLEECRATAPAELTSEAATGSEHALFMSRLTHELDLRQKWVMKVHRSPTTRSGYCGGGAPFWSACTCMWYSWWAPAVAGLRSHALRWGLQDEGGAGGYGGPEANHGGGHC